MDRVVCAAYKRLYSGKVQRVPEEIYLQEKTECLFSCCGTMHTSIEKILKHKKPHFYITTPFFLYEYLPLLEESVYDNLIIPRTALESVREICMRTYRRVIRAIDRKNIPIIEDRNSKEIQEYSCTYSEDKSRTRIICDWYNKHIKQFKFEPLDGPEENNCECELCISVEQEQDLTDLKDLKDLKEGIEVGTISMQHRDGPGHMQCMIEGLQIDIKIPYKFLNRAIDGDTVVVSTETIDGQVIGNVINVERRSKKIVACVVHKILNSEHVLLMPINEKIPIFLSRTENAQILEKNLILAWIHKWDIGKPFPIGRIAKVLGKEGNTAAETAALLSSNSIIDQEFEDSAYKELPPDTWKPSEKDLSEREDLKHLPIASIDPLGCIDIDDALHARYISDTEIEIGVHIADVSHFVHEDSALDREGRIRGCSVYLPNRRIDMLPPLLGTNICSLHKNQERLTFSVIWTGQIKNNEFIISNTRYAKTLIKSREAFTYEEASSILAGAPYKDKEILESLRILKRVSSMLRKHRLDNNAFTIESADFMISAREAENLQILSKDPERYIKKEQIFDEEYETHSLVEEFMLLANKCVAEEISKIYPKEALIRLHPQPTQESFRELESALKMICPSAHLNPHNPKELAQMLKSLSKTYELEKVIGAWAARCMTQAVYAPSSAARKRHYGLAMDNYTHFTSPIRRYADVLVHRILYNALQGKSAPLTEFVLADRCAEINRAYRCAKYVARDANALFVRYLIPSTPISLCVISIQPDRVSVYSPEYNVSGWLEMDEDFSATPGVLLYGQNRMHSLVPLSIFQGVLSSNHPRQLVFSMFRG